MARAKEKGVIAGRPKIDQKKRKKIINIYIKSLEESQRSDSQILGARKISKHLSLPIATVSKVLREYREGKLDELGNSCQILFPELTKGGKKE